MSQTINSVMENTNKGNQTLEISGTIDHKTRIRLKKEEETRKR